MLNNIVVLDYFIILMESSEKKIKGKFSNQLLIHLFCKYYTLNVNIALIVPNKLVLIYLNFISRICFDYDVSNIHRCESALLIGFPLPIQHG